MAFNEVRAGYQSLNILDSEIGLVTKTRTATADSIEIDLAYPYAKAGSLFTGVGEYGIVFEDYYLGGETAFPISVIFQGRVRADRVSAAVYAKKSDFAAQGLYLIEPVTGATGSTGATGATGATGGK